MLTDKNGFENLAWAFPTNPQKICERFCGISLCTGMSSSPETETKTRVRDEPSTKESNKIMRASKIVFTLPLLLAALPVVAATSFTGTGWLTGVPVGVW